MTKFYDTLEIGPGEIPNVVEFSSIDKNRIAASIDDECNGYICVDCGYAVEFHRTGYDSRSEVRWSCGCHS
jgi:hypothetical protein